MPPEPPTSDMGLLSDKDPEPSLHDVMTMLTNINTRFTTTEESVHLATHMAATASGDIKPYSGRGRPTSATIDHQDALHGMEEQVHARVLDHLR